MKGLLRVVLGAVPVLVAAGCQRIDAPEEPSKRIATPTPAAPAFVHSDARLSVAHTGLRRLEFASEGPEPPLFFRERIATDGQGNYSIQPIGPQGSSVADWDLFELSQHAREGFLFRYRDFSVRAPELFEANWSLSRQENTEVAGRFCRAYRLERVVGEPGSYEICVDEQTNLILSSHEFDGEGRLIASMVYENLQLDFQHGAVPWHVPSNQEQALDPHTSLEEQLGTLTIAPRLIPDGYALLETSRVADGQGQTWLKHTYTDGIEALFFLQGLQAGPQPKSFRHGRRTSGPPESTSSVVVACVGQVTAIQGLVDGFDLMAIGKASEEELLDLVESALP